MEHESWREDSLSKHEAKPPEENTEDLGSVANVSLRAGKIP